MIFQRAVELEERYSIEQGKLSIGGIEQIAAQVGVSPGQVGEVIGALAPLRTGRPLEQIGQATGEALSPGEVAAPSPPIAGEFLGSPVKLTADRTVAGEHAVSMYAGMVEEIQRIIGTPGQAATLGRSLTWSTVGLGNVVRYVNVTVTPQDGQTTIHVEEQVEVYGRRVLGGLAGGGGGALFGFAFSLGVGLVDSPVSVLLATVFAIGGAAVTARSLLAAATTQRRQQLDRLADRLAELAAPEAAD